MNLPLIKKELKLLLRGHLLNPLWDGRMARRRRRGEAARDATCEYLGKYLSFIASLKPDADAENADRGAESKDRIFSIWLQGEENAPRIVKACFASMRRNCTQELVVLDEKTLPQWIGLPAYINEKYCAGKIRPAHYADICRAELLTRHGGIWLDATCFATSAIPESIIGESFFIYLASSPLIGYSFVQNCFFRAKKGDFLMRAWRDCIFEYWKREKCAADYFVHQLLFKLLTENNEAAAARFAEMPKIEQDPTHALWWDYRDKPFDRELFDRLCAGAFFQKTEYKSSSASRPIAGSFSDVMQNKMYGL